MYFHLIAPSVTSPLPPSPIASKPFSDASIARMTFHSLSSSVPLRSPSNAVNPYFGLSILSSAGGPPTTSSGAIAPSRFLSYVFNASAHEIVSTCCPGWFCEKPQPLIHAVSPWIDTTDFISQASPRTHHTRRPLPASYPDS